MKITVAKHYESHSNRRWQAKVSLESTTDEEKKLLEHEKFSGLRSVEVYASSEKEAREKIEEAIHDLQNVVISILTAAEAMEAWNGTNEVPISLPIPIPISLLKERKGGG
jgi:hypothetical protein